MLTIVAYARVCNGFVLTCMHLGYASSVHWTGQTTGWRTKRGTYMIYVDRAFGQFWKQPASIIAVMGGCSSSSTCRRSSRIF